MQMVEEGVNDIDMMGLSSREMEIIDLVADGLTNQEIAVKLTISKRTVDNHVSNMFTNCLLYTSPSPRDRQKSRMPSSA